MTWMKLIELLLELFIYVWKNRKTEREKSIETIQSFAKALHDCDTELVSYYLHLLKNEGKKCLPDR